MRPHLRRATLADLRLLAPIEAAADALFMDVGHPEISLQPTISDEIARQAIVAGLVTVAELGGEVVGWVQVGRCDGELEICQISVRPEMGRQGIGSALLQRVIDEATAAGEPSIVLDTQADVAWNMPWYRVFGFEVVPLGAWTSAMWEIAEQQHEDGLDWGTRVHMRRVL